MKYSSLLKLWQLKHCLCLQLLDLFPSEVWVITSKVTIGSGLDVPLTTTHQIQVTSNHSCRPPLDFGACKQQQLYENDILDTNDLLQWMHGVCASMTVDIGI